MKPSPAPKPVPKPGVALRPKIGTKVFGEAKGGCGSGSAGAAKACGASKGSSSGHQLRGPTPPSGAPIFRCLTPKCQFAANFDSKWSHKPWYGMHCCGCCPTNGHNRSLANMRHGDACTSQLVSEECPDAPEQIQQRQTLSWPPTRKTSGGMIKVKVEEPTDEENQRMLENVYLRAPPGD